jgi:hypothetical protein
MSRREEAQELVEIVCKALGTSLKNYMPVTKEGAISEAEYWLRDYADDEG